MQDNLHIVDGDPEGMGRRREAYVFGPIYFEDEDLIDEAPPAPGYYEGTIASAVLKRSRRDNVMLEVVLELLDVPMPYNRVTDYFVLEGAPRAVRVAKNRLVRLFRACGLYPKAKDEIEPAALFGAQVEVKVEPDMYRGRTRLRVTRYQPVGSSTALERIPF